MNMLTEYILGQALEIAAQFDKRNGNEYYKNRIPQYMKEAEAAT